MYAPIHRAELFFSFSVNFSTHWLFPLRLFIFLLLCLALYFVSATARPQTLRHRHQHNRTGKMTADYVGSTAEWADCSWIYIPGWRRPFTLVGSKSKCKPLTPQYLPEAYLIIDHDLITKNQPITSARINLDMPHDRIAIPCWGSVSPPRTP
jgi:hypothetical protein